jgi:hypothetical protein
LRNRFKDIQKILDDAVENNPVGPPHRAFWRDVCRDEFVIKQVLGCPIIHNEGGKFVGSQSLLVKILRGDTIDCNGGSRPQMPYGYDPISDEKIKVISDWIDAQCPE